MMKTTERPSADLRRKFSMIWGEKTTTQQAMDIEPQIPDKASRSMLTLDDIGGDNMMMDESHAAVL